MRGDWGTGKVSLNVTSSAGAGNGDGRLATVTFEVVAQRASTFYLIRDSF